MKFSDFAAVATAILIAGTGCGRRQHSSGALGSNATFVVEKVEATQVESSQDFDAMNHPVSKLVTLRGCVKDIALLRPIIGQRFTVENGTSRFELTSDPSGCLTWPETHPFIYEDRFVRETRVIRGQAPQVGSQTVELAMNLYENNPSKILDLRYAQLPADMSGALRTAEELEDERPSVALTSLSLQFLGHDYGRYAIDRDLKLTVAHRYRVQLSPRIRRRSSGEHKFALDNPLAGPYRITLALASGTDDEPVTADNLIAITRVDVQMRAGDLTADATFAYPQIQLATWRQRLVVSVIPLQSAESFAQATFVGRVEPMHGGEVKLVPSAERIDLESLLAQSAAASGSVKVGGDQGKELTPLQRLRASGTIRFAEVSALPAHPQNKSTPERREMEEFLQDGQTSRQKILTYICQVVYGKTQTPFPYIHLFGPPKDGSRMKTETDLDYCKRIPEASLRFMLEDFVETMRTPVPQNPGTTGFVSLGFSAGVTQYAENYESQSVGTTNHASVGASAGLELFKKGPFTLGATASIGKDWFSTYSRSRVKSLNRASNASTSRNMLMEHRSFEFEADVRRCVLFDARYNSEFKPVQICSGTVSRKRLRESFYYVAQVWNNSDSPFMDGEESGTGLRFFIRGDARYNAFVELAENPDLELVFARKLPPARELIGINTSISLDQAIPGALDAYVSEWSPPPSAPK
jgi:hypothetical protein